MKSPRPITAVDRMLAWADRADPGRVRAHRRRTHRRFGKLDLVVFEHAGEATTVYLSNDEGVIIEATVEELLQAADAVRDLLEKPPPVRRKR